MTTISKIQQNSGWVGRMAILICLLCLTAWSPPPDQPEPNLPPRRMPTRQPSDGDEPVGAHIELRVSSAPPGAWTGVQWRDELGHWREVDGWQGTLDSVDRKVWWVAQRHFGTGPYRWLLYASRGGPLLGTSHTFYLPDKANETLTVVVNLDRAHRPRPAPTGIPRAFAMMPTTGRTPANPWPSIVFVLALVIGGGLLSKYGPRRW